MAGSATDYLELKVLDHTLATTSYTKPTAIYLGLFTATPSDAGGGTEVSGNGYARQAVVFSAASGGQAVLSAAVEFTAAGGNWGTITHWAIFDALTTGNMLYWGDWTASKVINDTDTFRVPATTGLVISAT